MPNALAIKLADGSELFVPADKAENSIANKIVAAQIRQLIQANLKKYKDGEETLSPKQLAEIAMAGSALAKFSGEVYQASDPLVDAPARPGEETKVEEVDFGNLTKKPEGE